MLVSKPHFISSQTSLPDYKEYVKEQGVMGFNHNSDSFATMLNSQNKYGEKPSNTALDMMKAGHDVSKLNEAAINAAKGAAAQAQAKKAHFAASFDQNQGFFNSKVNLKPRQAHGAVNFHAQQNISRHVQENSQTKQDGLDVNMLAKIAENNRRIANTQQVQEKSTHSQNVDSEKKATRGIPLQRENYVTLTKKPIDLTPPAFNLDERSLATLSRVSKNKEKALSDVQNTLKTNEVELARAQQLGDVSQKSTFQAVQSKLNVNPHTMDKEFIQTPMGEHPKRSEKQLFSQLDHDAFFNTKPIRQNIKDDTAYLGELSAKYESAKDGISAIGYDRVGGTSYGKYQIASNVGTFDQFVNFVSKEAPDIASKLRSGGEANTGSRFGKMPKVWREIAKQEPERFTQLQEAFIKKTHYDPTITALKEKGVDIQSDTIKQVVWSTAVHHGSGGAKNILDKAIESVGMENPKDFIEKVYALRATKFSSSTTEVRQAVQNRLISEKNVALAQLT